MPGLWSKASSIGQRVRTKSVATISAAGFKDEYFLIFLSILIGAITAVGAHLFYMLLEYAYHFAYGTHGENGVTSFNLYGGRTFMLVILPVGGAFAVGLITYYFAREAKGHGVPEVMDAMHRHGGVIRPRVSLAKAICSALTIGTGGSAGTEGPIVQIGAAIGSTFGQLLRIDRRQMGILIACGVAAGIAAIFNAPIAGVLFALEIFLKDFSFKTFSPIVFASVIATSITHHLRSGDNGIFEVINPEQYFFAAIELPYYLGLGLFCAIGAVIFIRLLYWIEDVADIIKIPEPIKPVLGALLLGVLGVACVLYTQRHEVPPFFGNGYPLIRAAISPKLIEMSFWFLAVLCILKTVATGLTLGSGGSGGIFAPSLFIGACVGGAFGITLQKLGLIDHTSASAYAIVGMAAVVAATTHAPLTAIVILYELTREPRVILPIMFAAIVATGLAQLMLRESIYTLKLVRRGIRFGRLADLTILKRMQVDQIRVLPAPFVHPIDPLQKLLDMAEEAESPDFVVVDSHGDYLGMVVGADVKTALLQPEAVPLLLIGELVRSGIPTVSPRETLDSVMDKFAHAHVNSLPLTSMIDSHRVEGLITREAIMDRYQQELEQDS